MTRISRALPYPDVADQPFRPPLEPARITHKGSGYSPAMPAAEYLAMGTPKRKNKYGVAPVDQRTVDGIVFASAAEARRWSELKLLEKSGYIRNLERQPEFPVEINGTKVFSYFGDFRYREGCTVKVEDTKGVRTAIYKLKKRIIEAVYGIKIIEVL